MSGSRASGSGLPGCLAGWNHCRVDEAAARTSPNCSSGSSHIVAGSAGLSQHGRSATSRSCCRSADGFGSSVASQAPFVSATRLHRPSSS